MKYFKNNLTKSHMIVFACMLVLFMILVFLITDEGLDNHSKHNIRVLQTTAGAFTGPLVGAISRGFQSCCLKFSFYLMAYCAPALAIGVLVQFIRLPDNNWVFVLRMGLWILAWLFWFICGISSLGHALS